MTGTIAVVYINVVEYAWVTTTVVVALSGAQQLQAFLFKMYAGCSGAKGVSAAPPPTVMQDSVCWTRSFSDLCVADHQHDAESLQCTVFQGALDRLAVSEGANVVWTLLVSQRL